MMRYTETDTQNECKTRWYKQMKGSFICTYARTYLHHESPFNTVNGITNSTGNRRYHLSINVIVIVLLSLFLPLQIMHYHTMVRHCCCNFFMNENNSLYTSYFMVHVSHLINQ